MAMVAEDQQPVARAPLAAEEPPVPPPPPPLPQPYKHRCRVCREGFVCGRALGGHMRAHGITDGGGELSADDGDDSGGSAGDSSEAAGSASAATAKRMYALRTNPSRLMRNNCRACENCGKEFTSWKSLLDHGRCNNGDDEQEHEEGDVSNIAGGDAQSGGEVGEDLALAAGGWSKRKRTRRAKVMVVIGNDASQIDEQLPGTSREEEDLANCLVMLASSSSSTAQPHAVIDIDKQASAASVVNKLEDERIRNRLLLPPQPISMVAPAAQPQLKLLAPPPHLLPPPPQHVSSTVPRGMFECKACKKVFTSHQALGGHRASHKKVKGCFAAKLESSNRDGQQQPQPGAASPVKVVVEAIPAIINTEPSSVDGNAEGSTTNAETTTAVVVTTAKPEELAFVQVDEVPAPTTGASPFVKKKGKVHECSICHRVFMSGQALGGHKRCHWLTTGSAGDATAAAVAKLPPFVTHDHVMHAMCQQLTLGRRVFDAASDPFLDLNMPNSNASADPAAAATQQAAELNDSSMLSLNAPASLYMHSWAAHSNASNNLNTATSGQYGVTEATATEDEADSSTTAKRAKISDLKDMNMAGETSPWLQVGIALPSDSNEKTAEA